MKKLGLPIQCLGLWVFLYSFGCSHKKEIKVTKMDQSTPISIATTEVPQDAIFFLRLKKEPHFEGLPVVDWPENTISLSQGRAIKFLGDTSILKDQHGILQTWGVVKIHAKVQLEMKKQFIQEVKNRSVE